MHLSFQRWVIVFLLPPKINPNVALNWQRLAWIASRCYFLIAKAGFCYATSR
jgi:hypothetical protein